MISTMCSFSVSTVLAVVSGRAVAAGLRRWSQADDGVHGVLDGSTAVSKVAVRRCARARNCARAVDAEQASRPLAGRRRWIADAEIGLHAARRLAAGAHRLDHGGRAGDDVAAGEDARQRRGEAVVGRDVAPLVELQPRGLAHDRIGVGADRVDDQVGLEVELAAGDRRPAGAGRTRRARRAPCARSACRARCRCRRRAPRPGWSASGTRRLPARRDALPRRAPALRCCERR